MPMPDGTRKSSATEAGRNLKTKPDTSGLSALSGFVPWIVYGILSATWHGGAAYVGGLIASLCQIVPQCRARRVKILDGAALLFFLAGTVATLVLHSLVFLRDGSVLVWGMFCVVAWGSLLAGSPFTAQYAREAVAPEYWDSPVFRRANVVITAVWGTVFAVNTALALVLAWDGNGASGHTTRWLGAVPYVGIAFAIAFTSRYPQWVQRQR
jgi:all-trans-retinol 13,14-reductase